MSEILLGFVGDVLVDRDEPVEVFESVREVLAVPDVLFGLDSPEGEEVVRYLGECNQSQGLHSRIVPEGAVSLAGYRTRQVIHDSRVRRSCPSRADYH